MPYLPPPTPPSPLIPQQLVIHQGATFRQTFACNLAYFGIANIATWAVQGGSFTLSVGYRDDASFKAVCSGAVFLAGNNVTLELDETVTDLIAHRGGQFVVDVSDGIDTHRAIEGGWFLHRTTSAGPYSPSIVAVAENWEALLRSLSPRGPLAFADIGGRKILEEGSGKWTVKSYAAGTQTSPEVLSVLYRTRVNISWTGATVGVMVANDIVTGSSGWTARIVSINYGAKTAVLSLWTGTAAGAGAELLTSGGNSIAGVSVGAFAGSVTHYQATVTPGVFAPRAPAPAGVYNAVGSPQDSTLGFVFPYQPEHYNRQAVLPPDEMGLGAVLVVIYSATIKNTIPAGDNARLEFTLALGTSIFRDAELDIDQVSWLRCETDVLPAIAVETPVQVTLRLQSGRRSGFTQAQTLVVTVEGAGIRVSGTASGTLDLEDGGGLDRCARNVGLWMAASPEFQSGAGDFHLTVTDWLVALDGEIK